MPVYQLWPLLDCPMQHIDLGDASLASLQDTSSIGFTILQVVVG